MKPNPNQRRSRGRSGPHNGGGRRNSRNQNFESNGPEVKVRGSAQQVLDKYLQFARDAQSCGDRVKAEGYLQFAEHYYRIVNVDQGSGEGAAKQFSEDGDELTAHRPADKNQRPADKNQRPADKNQTPADKNQTREPRRPRRKVKVSDTNRTPAPALATVKNEATLAAEGACAAADKEIVKEVPTKTSKDTAVAGE